MKWFLFFLVFIFVETQFFIDAELSDLSIGAEGAILMNAKTGAILYEKEAYELAYPASTTKIATALYTLKVCKDRLHETVTAKREAIRSITPQAKRQSKYRSPSHWLETDATHIGIKIGEEFILEDLLHAMLVTSANDASNVIAQHVGGTIPKFMEELNAYLKEIGCKQTSFKNPHGLHHPDHVTTPYDLAIMAREGMKDPYLRKIVSTVRYTSPQTNLELDRTLTQGNRLLRSGNNYYSKAIGIKTGTTQAAGKTILAAAEEEGRMLIAVTLGCRGTRAEFYGDVINLFETAFYQPKKVRHLLPKGVQKVTKKVAGASGPLKTYLPHGLYYIFYPDEATPIKATIHWNVPSLPIAKGAVVGIIQVVDEEGNSLQKVPLFAYKELKSTAWHSLFLFFSENTKGRFLLYGGGIILIVLFLFIVVSNRKRRTASQRQKNHPFLRK